VIAFSGASEPAAIILSEAKVLRIVVGRWSSADVLENDAVVAVFG